MNGSEHIPEHPRERTREGEAARSAAKMSLEEGQDFLRHRATGMNLKQWKERYAAVPDGPDGTNPDGTFKPVHVEESH